MTRMRTIRRGAWIALGCLLLVGFTECGVDPLDTDRDGIGAGDQCVDVPGPASRAGCPLGRWRLENTNAASPSADVVVDYASLGFDPVTGDWNGDGTDTLGVFDPFTATYLLRNQVTPGPAQRTFRFGRAGTVRPVVGDWDGDGVDTVGLWDPTTGRWSLRNANSAGAADRSFVFDPNADAPFDWPVVGDWDGDGVDTVGVWNRGRWRLRNTNSPGSADLDFSYGGSDPTRRPVVGDWNGDGVDTVGVRDHSTKEWILRNTNDAGRGDLKFTFGPAAELGRPLIAVVGDWNGDGVDSIGVRNPA